MVFLFLFVAMLEQKNIETLKTDVGFSYCAAKRFNIQKVRARDLWHLSHRITRKILSHTISVVLNSQLGNLPLQLENLIKS